MKVLVPLLLAGSLLCGSCRGDTRQVVCHDGAGRWATTFSTGVKIAVQAAKSGGFATHSCEARLSWGDDELVAVKSAAQVDIDVVGADLGLGVPVVTLQTRQADDDWRGTYLIYSLEQAPRLLATITGGDFYRAVDADFDGIPAIWTTDAATMEGFDGLTYSDFDFLPTVVLRYDLTRLMDLSAEFPKHYDEQIARVRTLLKPADLAAFKASGGKLAFGSLPAARLAALRRTKARVLEIVQAFLYSGREDQAWSELAADWPAADVPRAKAAILAARTRGIEAQVSGRETSRPRRKKAPEIYESSRANIAAPEHKLDLGTTLMGPSRVGYSEDSVADTPPRPILMTRPPVAGGSRAPREDEVLDFVLDAAGKVRSVKLEKHAQDDQLLAAARDWKFVPAFKDGKPVACRYRIMVAGEQ